MSWWIVTIRISGDDEDSLYILQAASGKEAHEMAVAQIKDAVEDEDAEVYIGWIVRCPAGAEPTIWRNAVYGTTVEDAK